MQCPAQHQQRLPRRLSIRRVPLARSHVACICSNRHVASRIVDRHAPMDANEARRLLSMRCSQDRPCVDA